MPVKEEDIKCIFPKLVIPIKIQKQYSLWPKPCYLKLPPAPTPPLHVQQSYKQVTAYFATFLAFMVLSLNQARHFCHKEILTPSYHIKQGSSLAWL